MAKMKYSTSVFIGETTGGRPLPVFYDLHTPIVNNKPPGCLITGGPGSGKTFFGLTLAGISTILGKTTVILDPKGDFLSLLNIRDEIGRFTMIDMSRSAVGALDPFYMTADYSEKVSLVIEVIDLFLGGITDEQLTALSPIVKDVANEANPSLQKVVDELRGSLNVTARQLGTRLDLLKQMKFANLCFAPGTTKRNPIKINDGLTVITLVGLELPPPGSAPSSNQQRLASGILFLLTDFLRRVMMNDASPNPKTIIMDEAHVILASDAGARTVKNLALLGRSKFLALVLITQNTSHLEHLDIENTISSRFAFGSSRIEAERIISAMELPLGEGFESIITNLENGECLMKDFMDRYSTVQISAWKQGWAEAFNSNPLERLKKRRAE